MRRIVVAACVLMASCGAFAKGGSHGGGHSSGHVNPSNHSVGGYAKGNGTYVAPSHATNPNGTRSDNYSTKGNVNPYTGKAGTKD